jgi:hypothetical protein
MLDRSQTNVAHNVAPIVGPGQGGSPIPLPPLGFCALSRTAPPSRTVVLTWGSFA